MVGHDTAGWATIQPTTRPREATTQSLVRARGMAGGLCCDTQFCIMTEARDWPLGVVSRYNLCIVTGGQSGLRACHDTIACIVIGGRGLAAGRFARLATTRLGRRATRCDTARHACDTAGAGPATRHTACHDTAQCARYLGTVNAAWVHRARSQGPLGVHLVHPTQFWTHCTISVTV